SSWRITGAAQRLSSSRLRLAIGGVCRMDSVGARPVTKRPPQTPPWAGGGGDQLGRALPGEAPPQRVGRDVARHGGPQEREERLVLFPHREEPGQQYCGNVVGINIRHVGQFDREVGGGREQVLFGTEIAD